MANNQIIKSVSSCYLFKSRLQEFTQKVGLPTPVYETIKEGPPHEPTFASTVIVDNVRYDSLPGFYNRKAAEQSAAEVALLRLGNAESMQNLSQPALMSDSGVSSCYLFKSRLQEFTQKVGLPNPVYETIKEGPPHEPTFVSTVIVDNVRYGSPSGFYNRKAAEQAAAEVALMRLGNAESMQNLSQPVHETGLCKNLLQEYAYKMNFAMPRYECQSFDTESKMIRFSCTVDIGGRKYVGAAARTKKKAEINAARTALLAIQSSGLGPNNSGYTVVPMKKVTDLAISNQESAAALKPKKSKLKKKQKRKVSDANNRVRMMQIRARV